MKIALIIFTRNERKNSEEIFSKIPFKIVNKVYVIDGNSTDGTKDFWEKKGIKVFNQRYKGVGGAYESAFRNTTEEALIFFHPDGNMDPKEVVEFVRRMKRNEGFIIATRMVKGSWNEEDDQLLKPRKWYCQVLGLIANFIWSDGENKATDITQGFRAINREVYKKMDIKIPDAIAPDYEQVIKALKKHIRIYEFPTKEGKRKHGETSMTSLKTGLANAKVLLREIFN